MTTKIEQEVGEIGRREPLMISIAFAWVGIIAIIFQLMDGVVAFAGILAGYHLTHKLMIFDLIGTRWSTVLIVVFLWAAAAVISGIMKDVAVSVLSISSAYYLTMIPIIKR